jgi:hydrogenase maturation protease
MSEAARETLIIGVGNVYRGDDGAGIAAARLLKSQVRPGIRVIEQSGDGTALAESWKGVERVILVDAVQSGAAPGTMRRFDLQKEEVPREILQSSTHTFGIADAIELARALKELPPRLLLYTIEGERFGYSGQLTDSVASGVRAVVTAIQEICA